MIKVCDLFAGIGGVRLGFEQQGFTSTYSNDFFEPCKKTFDLNFSNPFLTLKDINDIDASSLPDFDILTGGFPCQPFSIAGNRQGFDDDKNRGNLFFTIMNIVKVKKPKVVVLENVKNLINHNNGKTLQIILSKFTDLNYSVKYRVLNGTTHGNIPQNRERVFIVAFSNSKTCDDFKFPEALKLTVSFKDFLETNVSKKYYYNQKPLFDRIKNDIISKDEIYQWRRKYVRQNKKGVCPTLTANMGTGGHNVPIILDDFGIRKLTPRECFNLMGFPKSFKLPDVNDSILYKQAGNSVIVPIINKLAEQIKLVL